MSGNSNQQLRKTIGFNAALSTVVGILIGSGVFFKPQAIYSATNGGPGLGLLAWLIGGLITIAAGLTAAEVSASIIKPGGLMVYLEEIYGERIGFLTGWMQLILFVPAIVAALGIIFAQECVSLLGLNNELYVIAIAIGVIVFIVSLNSLGAKFGGAIQTASTICKLLPLAVIIIFGLIKGDSAAPMMTPLVGEGANIISVLSTEGIPLQLKIEPETKQISGYSNSSSTFYWNLGEHIKVFNITLTGQDGERKFSFDGYSRYKGNVFSNAHFSSPKDYEIGDKLTLWHYTPNRVSIKGPIKNQREDYSDGVDNEKN